MDQSTEALAMLVNELSKRVGNLERLERPVPPVVASASCAILTKSATQSISSNTLTAITFNGELVDTDNYHNNSTNPSRLTAPSEGYYLVGGSARVATFYDQTYMQVAIRKNGADANGDGSALISQSAATTAAIMVPFVRLVHMSAGDYVELMALHSRSGYSANIATSSDGTSFWIFKVG